MWSRRVRSLLACVPVCVLLLALIANHDRVTGVNSVCVCASMSMFSILGSDTVSSHVPAVCALHPVPILIIGLLVAVGLSFGVVKLKVTTDPIELWASPTSRSRVEKDYFDQNFGPFYRTEMLIIRAKDLEPVSDGRGGVTGGNGCRKMQIWFTGDRRDAFMHLAGI